MAKCSAAHRAVDVRRGGERRVHEDDVGDDENAYDADLDALEDDSDDDLIANEAAQLRPGESLII